MIPFPHQPEALFFDAAGTLFELIEPVGSCYARLAAERGMRLDADAADSAFRSAWKQLPPSNSGRPSSDEDREWWKQLVRITAETARIEALTDARFEDWFEQLYLHYATPDAWRLYPDVLPALQAWSSQVSLHLLSNFDARLLTLVDALGIGPYFESATLSSQVGYAKPHPGIFQSALQQAGVTPDQALHVGDELKADLQGAERVGMACFLVDRPGQGLEELREKIGFSHLQDGAK